MIGWPLNWPADPEAQVGTQHMQHMHGDWMIWLEFTFECRIAYGCQNLIKPIAIVLKIRFKQ